MLFSACLLWLLKTWHHLSGTSSFSHFGWRFLPSSSLTGEQKHLSAPTVSSPADPLAAAGGRFSFYPWNVFGVPAQCSWQIHALLEPEPQSPFFSSLSGRVLIWFGFWVHPTLPTSSAPLWFVSLRRLNGFFSLPLGAIRSSCYIQPVSAQCRCNLLVMLYNYTALFWLKVFFWHFTNVCLSKFRSKDIFTHAISSVHSENILVTYPYQTSTPPMSILSVSKCCKSIQEQQGKRKTCQEPSDFE